MNRSYMHPAVITGIACLTTFHLYRAASAPVQAAPVPKPIMVAANEKKVDRTGPRIQVAILLDTSNSMDGLIAQAKAQLWNIVKELSKAEVDGKTPQLEVALYEYGNDGLPITKNYVRKVLSFSTDLDQISEELTRLKTNGGEEYCGAVLGDSLKELEWSTRDNDMRAIFIAGNEPFNQGNVSYKEACAQARTKNIVVNTIFCGNKSEGERTFWMDGATLASGRFLCIDSDRSVAEVATPYDSKLSQLNDKLNTTYVAYGRRGGEGAQRQMAADQAMASTPGAAGGYTASRAQAKATENYSNEEWDLVDAEKKGKVRAEALKKDDLPTELRDKSADEVKAYVTKKAEERAAIQKEIREVGAQRDQFIAAEKAKAGPDTSLEGAILGAIREQAKQRGFKFK